MGSVISAEAYLTVASILAGFGVTVLMFRLQRELYVQEQHPEKPTWLAWADYLVLAAIALSLLLVVLPIVAHSQPPRWILRLAAGSCAAAAILLAAYPLAILDHYRIEIGKNREGYRVKGEPVERIIVIVAVLVAEVVFAAVVWFGG